MWMRRSPLKPYLRVTHSSFLGKWECRSFDWVAYGRTWQQAYTRWYRAAWGVNPTL